jgi:hypothetical protein
MKSGSKNKGDLMPGTALCHVIKGVEPVRTGHNRVLDNIHVQANSKPLLELVYT